MWRVRAQYLLESKAELSVGEGEKQVGVGTLTAPLRCGFVGVQHRGAPGLQEVSGFVRPNVRPQVPFMPPGALLPFSV